MKKLLSLTLTLCSIVVVAAQERVMDKSEFDSLVSNGSKHHVIWKGENYRMTVTTSSKAVGRSATDWSSKMIFEYGSANELRSISFSSFGDKVNPTMQSLRVGEWVYLKSGDSPWTRKKYEASAPTQQRESLTEQIKAAAEYKHLGAGTFLDGPVQIYVKNEKRTTVDKKSGSTSESDTKSTYWIDANGTVLKSEYSSENRGASVVSRTTVTTVWEKDASIKFTPPEIVP